MKAATKADIPRAELWEEKLICNHSGDNTSEKMGIHMRETTGVKSWYLIIECIDMKGRRKHTEAAWDS